MSEPFLKQPVTYTPPLRHSRNGARQITTLVALGAGLLLNPQSLVWAQAPDAATVVAAPAVARPVMPASGAAAAGPQWKELSPAQQQILQPLATSWNSLGVIQKGKWIAITKNYPSMAPAEQEKLNGRMAEWAALKPRDRERARLNFAETKKIPPAERVANWEAYQALSPEEKQKLAARAPKKPVGTAIAVKPVPSGKLAEVPVTRRTPPQGPAAANGKPVVDRNTLLPRAPRPAASVPAPATTPVPASAATTTAPAPAN